MTATIAIAGMMNPPRSSFDSLTVAPARAVWLVAAGALGAELAACAKTGVLTIEAASIATKDAFLKLISNSLLSWRLPNCHMGVAFTTLKLANRYYRRKCCRIARQLNFAFAAAYDAAVRRLLLLFAAFTAAPAAAQGDRGAELLALRAQDARVATIGHRLATANRDHCRAPGWQAGIMLHDLAFYGGGYDDAARRVFALGDGPAVLALAAGGPGERAGLRADDRILALDGVDLAAGGDSRHGAGEAERLWQALDAAFADGVADISVRRAGGDAIVRVEADRGCATRFQQVPAAALRAEANGVYVEITSALVAFAGDEGELAAVIAHELAHNLLEHRRRLNEAGVRRGLLRFFGRNARLFRETEAEADRLSVHLLDRAGYDPDAAARFWRRFGPRSLGLGDPTHPAWRSRLAAIEEEAGRIRAARAAGARPVPPAVAQMQ